MRSTLCLQNVTPPSTTLLRFLRSQSEGLCFFTQNSSFENTSPAAYIPRVFRVPSTGHGTTTLESNLFNLDFLFPRASSQNIQRSKRPQCVNNNVAAAHGVRYGSTEQKKGWLRRMWKTGMKHDSQRRLPRRAPYESSSDNEMFGHGRSGLSKAVNEPRLRCTELDENGNVVLASGEFKKTELIARVLFNPLY